MLQGNTEAAGAGGSGDTQGTRRLAGPSGWSALPGARGNGHRARAGAPAPEGACKHTAVAVTAARPRLGVPGPGGRHRCGPAPSARPGTRRAGKRRHTQLDAINKTFIPTTVAQGTNQIKKKKKRKGNRKNVVSSFRLRASCAVCAHARPLSAESLGLRTRRGGSLTPVRIPARLFPECRTVCVLSGSSRARPATP